MNQSIKNICVSVILLSLAVILLGFGLGRVHRQSLERDTKTLEIIMSIQEDLYLSPN